MSKKSQGEINANTLQRDDHGRLMEREDMPIKKEQFINELLVNGGNKTAAAQKIGVSRAVVYKWFDDEEFVDKYKKACEKMYQNGFNTAVRTMLNLMKCKDSRTALKACEDVLKLNGYLDTKVDISQNPSEIVITLADSND